MNIEIKNIDFAYSSAEHTWILKSFSLSIELGKITAIVGTSGSGKSTLLKLISGLLLPVNGSILIDGIPVEECRKKGMFGLVFQTADLLPWRTLKKNVQLPFELQNKLIEENIITNTLTDVGLLKWIDKYPHELSGGMQQRAALARAVVAKPNILLLDEPFSQLDEILRFELLFYIQNYAVLNNATVILITHDISEAVIASDSVYVLSGSPVTCADEININIHRPRTLETANNEIFYKLVSQVRESLQNQTHQLLNV